jgi:hypothetical protein
VAIFSTRSHLRWKDCHAPLGLAMTLMWASWASGTREEIPHRLSNNGSSILSWQYALARTSVRSRFPPRWSHPGPARSLGLIALGDEATQLWPGAPPSLVCRCGPNVCFSIAPSTWYDRKPCSGGQGWDEKSLRVIIRPRSDRSKSWIVWRIVPCDS